MRTSSFLGRARRERALRQFIGCCHELYLEGCKSNITCSRNASHMWSCFEAYHWGKNTDTTAHYSRRTCDLYHIPGLWRRVLHPLHVASYLNKPPPGFTLLFHPFGSSVNWVLAHFQRSLSLKTQVLTFNRQELF